MVNIDVKEQVERRFRRLLDDYGIPQPDRVEYEARVVRFIWTDQKVILEIDVEDFEESDANGSYTREGLAA